MFTDLWRILCLSLYVVDFGLPSDFGPCANGTNGKRFFPPSQCIHRGERWAELPFLPCHKEQDKHQDCLKRLKSIPSECGDRAGSQEQDQGAKWGGSEPTRDWASFHLWNRYFISEIKQGRWPNVGDSRTKTHMLTWTLVTQIPGQQGRVAELVGGGFLIASSEGSCGFSNHLSSTKLNSFWVQHSLLESWNRANPYGGLCFCSCSSTGAWITTSKACFGKLFMALQAHPCKSNSKAELLLEHLRWPWSLDRSKWLVYLRSCSEYGRQGKDCGSAIKGNSANPVVRAHGYWAKERKVALMC